MNSTTKLVFNFFYISFLCIFTYYKYTFIFILSQLFCLFQIGSLLREKAQLRSGNLELNQKVYCLEEERNKLSLLHSELQLQYEKVLRAQKPKGKSGSSSNQLQPPHPVHHSEPFHGSSVSLATTIGGSYNSTCPKPYWNQDPDFSSMSVDSLNSRRLSTSSLVSNSSTSSRTKVVPDGSGSVFTCAEEEDFPSHENHLKTLLSGREAESDAERISELQRRNTLVLPHMRTVYPSEFQFIDPTINLNEESIRVRNSNMNLNFFMLLFQFELFRNFTQFFFPGSKTFPEVFKFKWSSRKTFNRKSKSSKKIFFLIINYNHYQGVNLYYS